MNRLLATLKFFFDTPPGAVVVSPHILRGSSVNRCGAAPKGAAPAFSRPNTAREVPP
jgi:hypothetical protein